MLAGITSVHVIINNLDTKDSPVPHWKSSSQSPEKNVNIVHQEQRGAQEGISHTSSPKHIQVVLVLFGTPEILSVLNQWLISQLNNFNKLSATSKTRASNFHNVFRRLTKQLEYLFYVQTMEN
jgi:hypothetical protein